MLYQFITEIIVKKALLVLYCHHPCKCYSINATLIPFNTIANGDHLIVKIKMCCSMLLLIYYAGDEEVENISKMFYTEY
ncbi:hypothetical protein T12_14471 [Trichinella patagoniensis]|uniref:Uncharacterized protein n=1 Tax=Trichinella patagoniensis TaxID=990121 RepID=A0A0V1A7F1_9BILA|nr:hypothetical protein T12_14471 [Trichinella patagoniensis]